MFLLIYVYRYIHPLSSSLCVYIGTVLASQVELAGGKGVKVATILEDPVVKPGEMHIYTTHTKHFPVRGSGFLAELDGASKPPAIVIDGISAANYKIQVCMCVLLE